LLALNPFLQNRIKVVDTNGRVGEQARAILAPVVHGLGGQLIPTEPGTPGALSIPLTVEPEHSQAVGWLFPRLYDFLLGLRYGLHVDIDLEGFKGRLHLLRSVVTDSSASMTLATLHGLLSTYRAVELPGIALTSHATSEQIAFYKAFIEDSSYQELSKSAGAIGSIGLDMRHMVEMMARTARSIVQKPFFAPVSNLVTKLVSASTSTPVPDSELARSLLSRSYLPPIVSLSEAISDAHQRWLVSKEPLEITAELRQRLGRGKWVEVPATAQPTELDFGHRR
jgi:hypothetical protein